jgi:hypothetical protein
VTRLFLLLMMLYAACGLVLSFAINAASFAGLVFGGNALFQMLFWGIFPAFLTVILIAHSERKKKPDLSDREIDHWELVLAGGPVALRYLFWICCAYAIILGVLLAILQSHEPSLTSRGASAFFMMFYALGLAATTAALRRRTG